MSETSSERDERDNYKQVEKGFARERDQREIREEGGKTAWIYKIRRARRKGKRCDISSLIIRDRSS
jgi:hypothetical protein